jgi:YesN/AraC family two-component response regulator
MPYRILIADDDQGLCDLFRAAILRFEPSWAVEVAGDGREALGLLCKGHFDVAVLDVRMPYLDGLEVLKEAKKRDIQTDVIILTGYGDVEKSVQAMKEGARDFLQKPIRPEELVAVIRKLIESHHPLHVRAEWLDNYLRECALDPSLKIGDLCQHFNIVRSYVSTLFREHLHMSFEKRRAYHRVQMAKRLLESTDAPLKAIATQCGFRNRSRLTEAFRKQEGISPTHYRKMGGHGRTE